MIVRHLSRIIGTDRDVKANNGNWRSRRILLKQDGMGFSFHDTIIKAGTETMIHYKNHLEAVYCIQGNGEIETLKDNIIYQIEPGMLYALNDHDKHLLRGGTEDMRLICVFNPPLTGEERHNEDGSYDLLESDSRGF